MSQRRDEHDGDEMTLRSMPDVSAPPFSVAVCVCTYRRPAMLGALLERLIGAATKAGELARVGVVVVDDDPDRSAERIASCTEHRFELGVRYVHAGARNIAIARNLAMQKGIETASLVAFIDDDCLPSEDWLLELVKTFAVGGADIITGVCLDHFPEPCPPWIHRGPYFDRPLTEPDGTIVTNGYIKNILIASGAIVRADLKFSPDFGRTGGEDEMFLIDARRFGLKNRRAARAFVTEQVPANRLTFQYQLRRRFWYGNTESLTSVACGGATRLRAFLRGGRMVAAALPLVPMRLAGGQPAELHSAVAVLLQGVGRILGAFGVSVNHR